MKKLLLILLGMIFTCSVVYGAEIETVTLKSQDENHVVISGASDASIGKKVTVSVFKEGRGLADISEFGVPTDTIAFADTVFLRDGKEYEFDWTPTVSGVYDIYVSADGKIEASEKSVYIPADAKELYDAVRGGSADDISALLSKSGRLADLLMDKNAPSEIRYGDMARAICCLRDEYKGEDIKAMIDGAGALARLANLKTAKELDGAAVALNAIGLGLECRENMEKYADNNVKAELASRMDKICEKSMRDIQAYFNEQLILSGIYKSSNWMDGKKFLEIISYPSSDGERTSAAKALTGRQFDNLDALKKAADKEKDGAASDSSGGGNRTGGGGGGGGRISAPAFSGAGENAVVPIDSENIEDRIDSAFPDVDKMHYAFDDINYLRWHDIVSGDENGRFNPENNVTRAEILKMLCTAFNIPKKSDVVFEDVKDGDWFGEYAAGAAALELVYGDENGNFYPNEDITRQDLAVMIWRFAKSAGYEFGESGLSFNDAESISEYAREAVAELSAAGIINGTGGGAFSPAENATRAQAAAITARSMRRVIGGVK